MRILAIWMLLGAACSPPPEAVGKRVLILGVPEEPVSIERLVDLSWPDFEADRVAVGTPHDSLVDAYHRWRDHRDEDALAGPVRAAFYLTRVREGPHPLYLNNDAFEGALDRAVARARDLALISTRAERGSAEWEAAGRRFDEFLATGNHTALLGEFGEDSRVREVLAFFDPAHRSLRGDVDALTHAQSPAFLDSCRHQYRSVLASISVEGLGLELVAASETRTRRLVESLEALLEDSDDRRWLVVIPADLKPLLEDALRRREVPVTVVPSSPTH